MSTEDEDWKYLPGTIQVELGECVKKELQGKTDEEIQEWFLRRLKAGFKSIFEATRENED